MRSNWGPPTAGVYALKSQIDKWMTLGWAESTVVIRFWIISVVLALIGLATLKLR